MKKFTIINAYGDKNIGDAAIQESAFNILNELMDKGDLINLITVDDEKYVKKPEIKPEIVQFIDPYGYAIATPKGNLKSFQKLIRFVYIFFGSIIFTLIGKINTSFLPVNGNFSYILALTDSDVVLGMGGGYYLTKRKYKDYFGLILTLLPIIISNIFNKKLIILPVSFGPFASKIHRNIAFNIIKKHTIIVRDNISLTVLKKINKNHNLKAYYSPDLALFLPANKISLKEKQNSNYIILTARDWFLDQKKQKRYEQSLAEFIDNIWSKENINTLFIPMAKNKFEDDDNLNARRIMSYLKFKKAFKVYNPKNINDLINVASKARFAICTRMHSAIISAIAGTPFIAIGYGHKTLGFVSSFGIEKWHIDINDINYENLYHKYSTLFKDKNYVNFTETIERKLKEIQKYRYLILNEIKKV